MKIKVGISGDLLNRDGVPCFGNEALSKIKKRSDIDITWMDKSIQEITEEMASEFDAILLNLPKASAKSISRDDCKLKIISRFGVGYDSVDIKAMKEKRIVVTNTPNAVRRPVAVAALTMMFALSGKLLKKNDLVRSGQWNDRTNFMGMGLTQKTLGVVGAGSIGQETIKLSLPFFKKIIAFDPFLTKEELYSRGAVKTELLELATSSDIVVVLCNLNKSTEGMINNEFFSHMKETSFIINLSRGPVINEGFRNGA
jgi:D-3-phosphoglycerate dehydrogenase